MVMPMERGEADVVANLNEDIAEVFEELASEQANTQ